MSLPPEWGIAMAFTVYRCKENCYHFQLVSLKYWGPASTKEDFLEEEQPESHVVDLKASGKGKYMNKNKA